LGSDTKTPVQAVRIEKQWQATFSVRAGATFDIAKFLSAHAGILFETGAAPEGFYNIDYAHPTRIIVTAGLSARAGPIELTLAGLWSPTVSTTVSPGAVLRGQSDAANQSYPINTGLYTSGALGASLGVRGNFGGL
jgi:hypothetical protein